MYLGMRIFLILKDYRHTTLSIYLAIIYVTISAIESEKVI